MTSSVAKVSRMPLIVGIISAVLALWFLTAAIRSLLTYNGSYHTTVGYSEQILTVNPDGSPHSLDINDDIRASMTGEKPKYIERHQGNYYAYTHSDLATDEYELNCFGLFGSQGSIYQGSRYDVESDKKSPELYQMFETQKELTLKRLEDKSEQAYRSLALRWTLYNSLFFLFFTSMAFLWIFRYRHLKAKAKS